MSLYIAAISSGGGSNCILTNEGKVKCWGMNNVGQLGLGDKKSRGNTRSSMAKPLPYVDLGQHQQAIEIKVGFNFACVILIDNNIKCWGKNTNGELGQGHSRSLGVKKMDMGDRLPAVDLGENAFVDKISLGNSHVCVIIKSNSSKVICFGLNTNGQLGIGKMSSVGKKVSDMGNNLVPVTFGANLIPFSIHTSSTAHHTCLVFTNKKSKCWGLNNYGQLGVGNIEDKGKTFEDMGDNLLFVDLKINDFIETMFVGGSHTCALLTTNEIKCWGWNNLGQLGIGEGGELASVGDVQNEMGINLKPMKLHKDKQVKTMSLGISHSCVLYTDGTVMCYGGNHMGQLGYGDNIARGGVDSIVGDMLPSIDFGTLVPVALISTGTSHNCVSFDGVSIKCFGKNRSGELGYGDQANRGDLSGEMGKNLPFVYLFDTIPPSRRPTMSPTKRYIPTKMPLATASPSFVLITEPPTEIVTIDSRSESKTNLYIAVGVLIPLLLLAFPIGYLISNCFYSSKRKKYLAFISHNKLETERTMNFLVSQIKNKVKNNRRKQSNHIISSNEKEKKFANIRNQIASSRAVIIILSRDYFLKVCCLVEMYFAIELEVPIIAIADIESGYDIKMAQNHLRTLIEHGLSESQHESTMALSHIGIDMRIQGTRLLHKVNFILPHQFYQNDPIIKKMSVINAVCDELAKIHEDTDIFLNPSTELGLVEAHEQQQQQQEQFQQPGVEVIRNRPMQSANNPRINFSIDDEDQNCNKSRQLSDGNNSGYTSEDHDSTNDIHANYNMIVDDMHNTMGSSSIDSTASNNGHQIKDGIVEASNNAIDNI